MSDATREWPEGIEPEDQIVERISGAFREQLQAIMAMPRSDGLLSAHGQGLMVADASIWRTRATEAEAQVIHLTEQVEELREALREIRKEAAHDVVAYRCLLDWIVKRIDTLLSKVTP